MHYGSCCELFALQQVIQQQDTYRGLTLLPVKPFVASLRSQADKNA